MKQIEGHNLNATSERRSKKPSSLFLVLVIPLLLQISAAVGLTSWLSIRSGKKAIEQLANQLMGEVGDRIQENLRTKLEIPHQLNRLNANLIELELLPTDNQALIGKHFFRQIQEFENIAYIYMGNPKGGLVSVQKSREANRLYFQLTQDFVKNDLINYAINASGNPETATENFGPYDATIRPWYAAAIETGKPIWSDTYIDAVTKKPLTRAVLPIYDNGGEILAVLAADIEIFEELNQLLGSLKIRQSGAIFIIQRTGELLASSLVESSSTSKNDEAILPQGAYSSSALIRTALKEAEAQIPNFQKIEEVRNFSFVLDGEKQFARVLPFQDERGLDWLIFIDVPESEFMAEIYAQERTLFCCVF